MVDDLDRHLDPVAGAARLHGVAHQVPHHLTELRAVRPDRRDVRARVRHLDIGHRATAARGERDHFARDPCHVDTGKHGLLRLRQIHHVRYQVVQAAGLAPNDVAQALVFVGQAGGGAQELNRARDRAQRIANFVRQTRRQTPERGHALGLVGALGRGRQLTAGPTQAIGQGAGEQRHHREHEQVHEQVEVQLVGRQVIDGRRLIGGRRDQPALQREHQAAVRHGARERSEHGAAQSEQARAHQARQAIEGGRAAGRAARQVRDDRPGELIEHELRLG